VRAKKAAAAAQQAREASQAAREEAEMATLADFERRNTEDVLVANA
jgi:hypothetical protein